MESTQIQESKKRSINYMQAVELQGKLKSKVYFVQYLDKHCKYTFSSCLTPLQCSSTCRHPLR